MTNRSVEVNRSVPTNSVLPHVFYRNLEEACEWLTRVFGFEEQYRYGEPVSGIQMRIGEACVQLSRPREQREVPAVLGCGTQMLTIIVPDVEEHYRRSKAAGAKIWEELQETCYGEKQYGVEDIDGHRWLFSQHARDLDPREWGARVKEI
jgi:uncharacterized glyoxalase superfamily protein PhnB